MALKKFETAADVALCMKDLSKEGLYNTLLIASKEHNDKNAEESARKTLDETLDDQEILAELTHVIDEVAIELENNSEIGLKPGQAIQVIGTYSDILLNNFVDTTKECVRSNADPKELTPMIKSSAAAGRATFLANYQELGLSRSQISCLLPALQGSKLHSVLG